MCVLIRRWAKYFVLTSRYDNTLLIPGGKLGVAAVQESEQINIGKDTTAEREQNNRT